MVKQEEYTKKHNLKRIILTGAAAGISVILLFYLLLALITVFKLSKEIYALAMLLGGLNPLERFANIVIAIPFLLFLGFIGTTLDGVRYRHKCNSIKTQFMINERVPIKIKSIYQKNNKIDKDVLQKYVVNWAYIGKGIKK
jgi:hypothetical protein